MLIENARFELPDSCRQADASHAERACHLHLVWDDGSWIAAPFWDNPCYCPYDDSSHVVMNEWVFEVDGPEGLYVAMPCCGRPAALSKSRPALGRLIHAAWAQALDEGTGRETHLDWAVWRSSQVMGMRRPLPAGFEIWLDLVVARELKEAGVDPDDQIAAAMNN